MKYETQPLPDIADCYFYHRQELPNGEIVGDEWDLRECAVDYTARVDFVGKSVLDVGTSSGFLSFYAEQQGAAEVTSFDLGESGHHNIIPWVENTDKVVKDNIVGNVRMKNGYWYCHHALKSKAKVVYGDLYDMPADLGMFDIVLMGSILLHCRDPFLALQNAARFAKQIVITDIHRAGPDSTFAPNFASSGKRNPGDLCSWWLLGPSTVTRMLDILGFSVEKIYFLAPSSPRLGYKANLFALSANRRL